MRKEYSPIQKALALSVHFLTASGLVVGFLALIAIDQDDFRVAMLWLLVAFLIDSIDGTFARLFKTKDVLPSIDGKSIDYVVDFVNYAVVPAYFMFNSEMVPLGYEYFAAIVVLFVSALYYGIDMISDDFHFIGFPVMWNMVIFYLFFVFAFGQWINFVLIIALAILHFVPVKFAYPSRATKWRTTTILAAILIFLTSPLIVWLNPETPFSLRVVSTLTLAYFGLLAIVTTFFDSKKETAT